VVSIDAKLIQIKLIQTITVDPWLLFNEIKNHHSNYINKLRDEKELVIRENFVKWFKLRGD
jgi:hypothetical protein